MGIVERFVKKGSKVYVEGQIETRKWNNSEGVTQYSTEIFLRPYRGEITLLDTRKDNDQEAGHNTDRTNNTPDRSATFDPQAPSGTYYVGDLSDDIPF